MNCSRFAAAGIAAMALGVALPSAASATDYCVAPNYDCGVNNVGNLQDALDQAATTQEADRVLLGEGSYVAPPVQTAFSYTNLNSPVEIVGAGRGKTVLTAKEFAVDRVLYLRGAQGSSVHDLTIRIPRKANTSFRGLMTANIARRLEIVADEVQAGPITGALLDEYAVLEDSSVELSDEQDTTGVLTSTPYPERAVTVRGSSVHAKTGIDTMGYAAIERSRVTGGNVGLLARGGETTIRDSLVRQTWTYGAVLKAVPFSGWHSKLIVDGVTAIGHGTPDVAGIVADTNSANNVDVRVSNSVIRGAFNALGAVTTNTGTAKISAEYSDYDGNENFALGGASIGESHVTNVGDAGFLNPANGDYRLRTGSPLVDRGDPDVPQGLDLDGNALVADGNGDGFARRDLGAFELQPAAPQPQPQGDTQPPVISAFRARLARLRYTLSENARVTVRIQRRLAGKRARYRTLGKLSATATQGANRTPVSRRIRRKALRPGRYRAVIVAVDTAGNRSVPKAASFRVKR
jgi:hypothetical protein